MFNVISFTLLQSSQVNYLGQGYLIGIISRKHSQTKESEAYSSFLITTNQPTTYQPTNRPSAIFTEHPPNHY